MAESTWSVGIGTLFCVSHCGYCSGTMYVMSHWRGCTTGQQREELSVYPLHSGWDLILFWKETALPWGQPGTLDVDKVLEFRVKRTKREWEHKWAVNREPVVPCQGERHLGEVSDLPICRRNKPRAKLQGWQRLQDSQKICRVNLNSLTDTGLQSRFGGFCQLKPWKHSHRM